jgi:transcriptional regulator with XRE-family HTH domain
MTPFDLRAMRIHLGLTRKAFAERYHISFRTLQELEQGRSPIAGTMAAFLTVIAFAPQTAAEALSGEHRGGWPYRSGAFVIVPRDAEEEDD